MLLAYLHNDVPAGSIALTDAHRVNSKVCTGELQKWTVYGGEEFSFDAREGAIGNTQIRATGIFTPLLRDITLAVRPRYPTDTSANNNTITPPVPILDAVDVCAKLSKSLFGCIVTVGDVYLVTSGAQQLVCRVTECTLEDEEGEGADQGEDFLMKDEYRGLIDAHTV